MGENVTADVTTANDLTRQVVDSVEHAADPRLRELVRGLIRHLHAFAIEQALTEAELMAGIRFLTEIGQTCTDRRQEFILLSDTLGVSTLVDAINNPPAPGATQSTVLGPFFVEAAPLAEQDADIDPGEAGGGVPLYVDVSVADPAGKPVGGATVDVWHSDDAGFYDVQRGGGELARRARFVTNDEGRPRFRTTAPAAYPIPDDGPVGEMLEATGRHPWRPAHVHFMISAPGFRRLVTHIFVDGDRYLDSDAVFGVKESLIDAFPLQPPGIAPNGKSEPKPYRLLRYRFGPTPA
jgi:hydroxyquinol 1,2-dioxygenase